MESNPIAVHSIIIGLFMYAGMMMLAGLYLASILRFFLKKEGRLAEDYKSSAFAGYILIVMFGAISVTLVVTAILLLGWLFDYPSYSLTMFVVGIATTVGMVTLCMHYNLDNRYRR